MRCGAADLKREMKTHSLTFAEALCDPRSDHLEVQVLLAALPGCGKVKAGRICRYARVEPETIVAVLGALERGKLLEEVNRIGSRRKRSA